MLLLETCLQASFLLTRQLWPHVGLKTPADYRNWEWSSWQSHQLPVVTYETVSEKDPHSFISPCVFWETRGEDIFRVSSVQSLSRVRLFATPWIAACHATLSITNSRSLLKTHVHRVGDAIKPSPPLSSPSPPAPNPSQHQGLFQWVNSSHVVAKVQNNNI